MNFRLRRPSPALVIACVALFASLGGVSYGFATGEIDGREIKNGAVTNKDIRNGTVVTKDLRNNEVRGADIRNSTIGGRDVAFNTLGGNDIKESTLAKVPDADNVDGVDSSGMSKLRLKPNFSAIARIASSPSSTASSAIGMLQLSFRASPIDTVAPPPQVPPQAFCTEVLVPGSVYAAGFGIIESIVYLPDASAVATVTILKVDPGGFMLPAMARFESGSVGSSSSAANVASAASASWTAIRFVSYDGVDTIASTRPVAGSIAMTAPSYPSETRAS